MMRRYLLMACTLLVLLLPTMAMAQTFGGATGGGFEVDPGDPFQTGGNFLSRLIDEGIPILRMLFYIGLAACLVKGVMTPDRFPTTWLTGIGIGCVGLTIGPSLISYTTDQVNGGNTGKTVAGRAISSGGR